jgi:shikimate kinase
MTRRVALVGLPGVGKSTVGAALAEALDARFVDVDDEIEALTGLGAARLLRERGEARFREAETEALTNALATPGDVVVATGGGAVVSPVCREALRAFGVVVHLVAPSAVVAARLKGGDRPLVAEPTVERVEQISAHRAAWYAEVATVSVDADGSIEDVVARVVDSVAAAA